MNKSANVLKEPVFKILINLQFVVSDVKVQNFAPCLGNPIPNPHPFVCPTLPPQTEVPTNPTTTQDCVDKCPVSEKFKPVCGTDGMTYINLESLVCRMKCGVGEDKYFSKSVLFQLLLTSQAFSLPIKSGVNTSDLLDL